MNTLIAISSFRKNLALDVIIKSLLDSGYGEVAHLLITDDTTNETAREIYEKYKDQCKLSYAYGSSLSKHSIWANKNRGTRFFLERTSYKYQISMDDDISYLKPGLIDEFINASKHSKYQHLTSYLGGSFKHIAQDGRSLLDNGFFQQFPPQAEDENVYWCRGSQGICSFYTREIVEKAGYMSKWVGQYGFEHAEYSSRINRIQGYDPELMPIIKRSPKYFVTQQVPNNYEVNIEEVQRGNGAQYIERMRKIYQGYGLVEKDHSLNIKGEFVIE